MRTCYACGEVFAPWPDPPDLCSACKRDDAYASPTRTEVPADPYEVPLTSEAEGPLRRRCFECGRLTHYPDRICSPCWHRYYDVEDE